MVQITAFSDIHMHKTKLPETDLAIFAGDFSYRGTFKEVGWWKTQLFNWKQEQPDREIIWICGNHELEVQDFSHILPEIAEETGTHYLEDSGIELYGLKIWASPYTPFFNNWGWDYYNPTDRWSQIPEKLDILITHGPPRYILDHTPENVSVGCVDLAREVFIKKPKVHLFGHIHHDYGHHQETGIDFYNVSICNEAYKDENKPILFTL
jgi:Icc-related predicted phosphoesterase